MVVVRGCARRPARRPGRRRPTAVARAYGAGAGSPARARRPADDRAGAAIRAGRADGARRARRQRGVVGARAEPRQLTRERAPVTARTCLAARRGARVGGGDRRAPVRIDRRRVDARVERARRASPEAERGQRPRRRAVRPTLARPRSRRRPRCLRRVIPKQTFGDGGRHYDPAANPYANPYGNPYRGGHFQAKQQAAKPTGTRQRSRPGGARRRGRATGCCRRRGRRFERPRAGAERRRRTVEHPHARSGGAAGQPGHGALRQPAAAVPAPGGPGRRGAPEPPRTRGAPGAGAGVHGTAGRQPERVRRAVRR